MAGTAQERAVFDKAVAATNAPVGAEPPPKKDTRVPPEKIWAEGAAVKAKKAADAAAVPEKETPEPDRGLDGKFTTPEKQQEQFDDAKYELARNALSRSGWKKAELDALDPSDLIKRGLKRAAALEKDDEAHRIAKEAREAAKKSETTGKTETGSNPPQFKLPDTSKILEPLRQTLALDEAGAKTLKQTFDEFASMVSEAAAAPLRDRLSEFERMQRESGARTEAELVTTAKEEVGKRYPDLLDPETFETVAENVRVMANLPKYQKIASLTGRVNACFEDACKLLGLQPAESDSQVRDAAKAQRRASGSTVGDRARPVATTAKEKDREWFDHVTAKNGLD